MHLNQLAKVLINGWMLAVTAIVMVSCGGSENGPGRNTHRPSIRDNKPQFKINFDKKSPVMFGESIHVNLEPTDTSLTIQSVEVSQPNFPFSFSSDQAEFDIPTQSIGGGNIRLKFEATYSDGTTGNRYKEFLVLAAEKPNEFNLSVVRKYPHDPSSFTQGFLIYDNFLYEGTGTKGESRLRKMDLSSGKVLQQQDNEKEVFGEGITIFNDKIFQLTYKSGRAFIYDLNSFEPLEEHSFSSHTGEGWGLTNNDSALVASDGSAFLYFLSPNDFSEMKRLTIFDDQGEVENLNELEYHKGKIYANLYTSAQIVAIDPSSGQVTDVFTARGIVAKDDVTGNMDVLNGVTFNPGTGNMLVTGKYWSKIYEVKAIAAED